MKFYALVLRKSIEVPDSKVKYVTKSGRRFATATYVAKGKTYTAYRVVAKK